MTEYIGKRTENEDYVENEKENNVYNILKKLKIQNNYKENME